MPETILIVSHGIGCSEIMSQRVQVLDWTVNGADKIFSVCNPSMRGTVFNLFKVGIGKRMPINRNHVDALLNEVARVRNENPGARIVVFGHSYGGGVVCSVLQQIYEKALKHRFVDCEFVTLNSVFIPTSLPVMPSIDVKHFMFRNDLVLRLGRIDKGRSDIHWLGCAVRRTRTLSAALGMDSQEWSVHVRYTENVIQAVLERKSILAIQRQFLDDCTNAHSNKIKEMYARECEQLHDRLNSLKVLKWSDLVDGDRDLYYA